MTGDDLVDNLNDVSFDFFLAALVILAIPSNGSEMSFPSRDSNSTRLAKSGRIERMGIAMGLRHRVNHINLVKQTIGKRPARMFAQIDARGIEDGDRFGARRSTRRRREARGDRDEPAFPQLVFGTL